MSKLAKNYNQMNTYFDGKPNIAYDLILGVCILLRV
jgi:hypothetical protein